MGSSALSAKRSHRRKLGGFGNRAAAPAAAHADSCLRISSSHIEIYRGIAMPFKKGRSGNPRGKPKGAKDKRTALRGLLQPHERELVQKAVDLALAGDTTALRMCMDRLMPPLRARDE